MNTKNSLRFEILEPRRCLSTAGILEDPFQFSVHEFAMELPSQIECPIYSSSVNTCITGQASDLLAYSFDADLVDIAIETNLFQGDWFWKGLEEPGSIAIEPPVEMIHLVFADVQPSSQDFWTTDQHSIDFDVISFRSFKLEIPGFIDTVETAAESNVKQSVNKPESRPLVPLADIRTVREFPGSAVVNGEQVQNAAGGVENAGAVQMQLNVTSPTVAEVTPSNVPGVQTQPELTDHPNIQTISLPRVHSVHTPSTSSFTFNSPIQGSLYLDRGMVSVGVIEASADEISGHDTSRDTNETSGNYDSVFADSEQEKDPTDKLSGLELLQPANWLSFVSLSIVTLPGMEGIQIGGSAIHGSAGSQVSQLSTLARILASASNNTLEFVPQRGNQILLATIVAGAGVGYTIHQKRKRDPGDRQPTIINGASGQESDLT